jgi:hypothetical protein
MELLICMYDKTIIDSLDKHRKLQLKKELFNYECIHQYFNDESTNKCNHYLSCYKNGKDNYGVNYKMYLRCKTIDRDFDDTHTIEVFNVRFSVGGKEHTFLKSRSKHEVAGMKRVEDTNLIVFYIVLKDKSVEQKKITLETECSVCYETNKQTYEAGFFTCRHTDLCCECFDKLQNKKCPICRCNAKPFI